MYVCMYVCIKTLQHKFGLRNEKKTIFDSVLLHLSHAMRFPTMWYVRQAKALTSLCIRAVWSEPLLVAWKFYEY